YMRHVADNHRMSFDDIYDSAARFFAVRSFADLQAAAVGASLPELEVNYRDQREQVAIAYSVLDAHAFLDDVPEPAEDELKALFEEAKNRVSAHQEDKLVFGYQLPDRVQIEWITLDPKRIEDQVQIRETQVRDWFNEHRDKYFTEVPAQQPEEGQPAAPA